MPRTRSHGGRRTLPVGRDVGPARRTGQDQGQTGMLSTARRVYRIQPYPLDRRWRREGGPHLRHGTRRFAPWRTSMGHASLTRALHGAKRRADFWSSHGRQRVRSHAIRGESIAEKHGRFTDIRRMTRDIGESVTATVSAAHSGGPSSYPPRARVPGRPTRVSRSRLYRQTHQARPRTHAG